MDVAVTDANDNKPLFTKNSYTFHVIEQSPSSTTVGIEVSNETCSGPGVTQLVLTSARPFELAVFVLTKLYSM